MNYYGKQFFLGKVTHTTAKPTKETIVASSFRLQWHIRIDCLRLGRTILYLKTLKINRRTINHYQKELDNIKKYTLGVKWAYMLVKNDQ